MSLGVIVPRNFSPSLLTALLRHMPGGYSSSLFRAYPIKHITLQPQKPTPQHSTDTKACPSTLHSHQTQHSLGVTVCLCSEFTSPYCPSCIVKLVVNPSHFCAYHPTTLSHFCNCLCSQSLSDQAKAHDCWMTCSTSSITPLLSQLSILIQNYQPMNFPKMSPAYSKMPKYHTRMVRVHQAVSQFSS